MSLADAVYRHGLPSFHLINQLSNEGKLTTMKKIVSIGAGYVGGPTMAVMADKCRDYTFVVTDIDKEKISKWNEGPLPIHEPGLDTIVENRRDKNLFFSSDVEGHISDADMIFISVDTPTKEFGEGAGMACDTSRVEACARQIVDNITGDVIVVEKTTVPVGMADKLRVIFQQSEHTITVLSNPEFLAEGTAIENLLNPDRVIIGSAQDGKGYTAESKLIKLYHNWVPLTRIITMHYFSSELSKLVSNAFLAQRVSSINSVAEICEKTGANIRDVAQGVGADNRIGPDFLKASLGFGGSCFRKDISSLVYIARSLGLDDIADYWHQVIKINDRQQDRLVSRVIDKCLGNIQGKTIAVFGFAFKANTGDFRDTPSARVCQKLMEEGARVHIHDPKALEDTESRARAKHMLENGSKSAGFWLAFPSTYAYAAAEDCDAIIIATEWPEYIDLDWKRIYASMRKPAVLMDGRNLLDRFRMSLIGFKYLDIGCNMW